jgi:hypothetical protein
MHMRADQSANWQMGLTKLMADETVSSEEKRKARICGNKLAAIAKTIGATPSELDLEDALKRHLREAGHRSGYINNLMSVFYRMIAAAPKIALHHENAANWRELIDRFNESSSVMRPACVNYVIAWVTVIGIPVEAIDQGRLMEFTKFLEERGLNPYESATGYRRQFRKLLIAAGLYTDSETRHTYDLPRKFEKIMSAMEQLAIAPCREKKSKVDLLADDWSSEKEPIRPVTWKRNKRNFIRYLNYQITRGFDGKDWSAIAHWKEIIRFVMDINENKPIAPNTATTLVVSIIACLRLLRTLGHLNMTDKQFDEIISDELWQRMDKFEDHFEKGGKPHPNLPAYEQIYRKFYESVTADFKKVRTHKSARTLQNLVIGILAVEYGWRPQDLKETLRREHIRKCKTLDGRHFYFVRYQPSKTYRGKSSATASAALPPWFNEVFDLYFARIEDASPSTPLFPVSKMSERVCRMSYRYLGEKYSANSYRKMLASFFQRNKLPGLYFMTGRTADRRLENITEVEMSHYAEGGTSEETLLEIRFGKRVQKILGIEALLSGR